MLHGTAIACLWLGLIPAASAQTGSTEGDPFEVKSEYQLESGALPRQIRIQVEFIDVSHEQFTGLMFGPKPPANDGELRQQVAQLIKDGKASVVETLLCTARSGHKATSESNEEFIYPTEYEPAEIVTESPRKDNDATEPAKQKVRDPTTGPTPTAFETRNVGSTLEIEPTLGVDHRTIDLGFVPEIVYHVGNRVWAEWKGEHGNSPVQMPTFYTLRTNTAVTLSDGHCMLVCRSGEKATLESIREEIYPTEYQPPRLPCYLSKGRLPSDPPMNPAFRTPTAFDTRNTGVTFEVEPLLESDGTIDLRLSPEIVNRLRLETWMEHVDPWGDGSIRMPIYESWRFNTSVSVAPGKFELITALTPKTNAPAPAVTRKILVFVRADVLPAP